MFSIADKPTSCGKNSFEKIDAETAEKKNCLGYSLILVDNKCIFETGQQATQTATYFLFGDAT